MKKTHTFLLAALGGLFVSGGSAEAYIGYGYRANDTVRLDHCYRSPAYDYAVPFYVVGPNRTRHVHKHRHHRSKDRQGTAQCCCEYPTKALNAPLK